LSNLKLIFKIYALLTCLACGHASWLLSCKGCTS